MKTLLRMVTGGAVAAACCGAYGQTYYFDILSYQVSLGQQWVQSSAEAPAQASGNAYSFNAAVQPTVAMFVKSLGVKTPAGVSLTLTENDEGVYTFSESMALAAAFNAKYGLGDYTFSFDTQNDGKRTVVLSLAGGQYPAAPRISNYAAAQTIDPEQDFDLAWEAFAGAGADDAVRLTIVGSDGSQVVDTGAPITGGPLSGTETSYTLSSGTLETGNTYTGYLTFYKMVRKVDSDEQIEKGYALLSRTTQFTLHAGSGGSTPGDTTPPTLVNSYPADNAVKVPTSTFMVLSFSENMAPQQAIEWSANIDPAKVTYTWQSTKALMISYAVGSLPISAWPSGATVTWKLNPTAGGASNFRDVAGNALEIGKCAGAFSTGSTISTNGNPTTNSPCHSEGATMANGWMISKQVAYVQTGADTVTVDPEAGATFGSSLFMPASANLTAATLTSPGGTTALKVTPAMPPFLTNSFAVLADKKASQAELDQAWPVGTYALQATATPAVNASLTMTAAYPPTPRFVNFAAIQAVDASADFVPQWEPFAGATAMDGISLSINGDDGTSFYAPDECATPPIELAATASSIVVPKGILTAGRTYTMELTFSHLIGTNDTAGLFGMSSLAKTTRLTLKTAGGSTTLTAPSFASVRRATGGAVELRIACMAQRPLVIESATDLKAKDWQAILTTNAPADTLTVVLPAGPRTFFRAAQQ